LDAPDVLKRDINQVDIVQLEVEGYDPALTDRFRQLPLVENVISHHLGMDSVYSLSLHTADSRQLLPGLIEMIGSGAGRIRQLEVAQPTLEDVFISLTGKQLRE
jgi:ABC-2 type transport system ATP-binding protein